MSELEKTTGFANFKGIVGGLDRVKQAIEKGEETKNYTDDDTWRKLQFSVKTMDDNVHFVQVSHYKPTQQVYLSKYENGESQTLKIDWEDRNRPLQDGWRIIGVSIKATGDENAKSLTSYDAIDYILDHYNDGDSVFTGFQISNSSYDGKFYKNYELKRMFVTKNPIDFTADGFEEQSDFEESFVFNNCYDDVIGLVINGFTINYKKEIFDVQYVVKAEDEDVANYFRDSVKFGDLLKVSGIVNNRVVYKYVEVDTADTETKAVVGRKTTSAKQKSNNQQREIESEDRSIQIVSIDEIEQGKYTKEDLEIVDEEEKMPWDEQ